MVKKCNARIFVCTVPVLLCCLLLSSCARARRFSLSELERRLCLVDKVFSFDGCRQFEEDGAYCVFYPCGESNMLLKAASDEKSRLINVSLTLTAGGTPDKDAFSALACALCGVFLPDGEGAACRSELHLEDTEKFFTRGTTVFEYGRYSAVFFTTAAGASLMLKYE